ncbi:helix-turn-helix domain-containing protein [Streptosporangium sp. KLBMP 9127]|nr:helix-turn-helix domain-containing protein [Streptosporangium sp. KLBMP 9127]
MDEDRASLTGPNARPSAELGALLRRLRIEHGHSQRKQAKDLHLSSHSSVADYEQGRRMPSLKTLQSYERLFGLPDGELQRWHRQDLEEKAAKAAQDLLAPTPEVSGREPGVPGESGESRAPAGRRRRVLTVAALLAVLLAAGTVAWVVLRPAEPPPMTWSSATSVRPLPTGAAQSIADGSDPARTDCGKGNVTTLATADIWIGQVRLGVLELRHSADCAMGWARLSPYGVLINHTSAAIRVRLETFRPADGVASRIDEPFIRDQHWGGMLDMKRGCVAVRGAIAIDGAQSGIVETPCTPPPV